MLEKFKPYFHHLLPVKWHLAGGILAGMIAGAASSAGVPLLVKEVFPALFKDNNYEDLWITQQALEWFGADYLEPLLKTCVAFLIANFFVRSSTTYISKYAISLTALTLSERIRTEVFAKLQDLSVSFYDENKSGDLLAKLNGDTEQLKKTLLTITSDFFIQCSQLLFGVLMIIYLSVQNSSAFFSLIALLSVPLCVIPIQMVGKKVKKRSQEAQKLAGEFSAFCIESMQSPQEIRSYNLQAAQKKRFSFLVKAIIRVGLKTVKYSLAVSPTIEFVAISGLALSLYVGVSHGMTWEVFFSLGLALYFSYEPVKKLGNVNTQIKAAEASIERIETILKARNETPEATQPKSIHLPVEGKLTFKNVNFRYKNAESSNLSQIDLTIQPGESVALVGESGAGKSTFLNLIPRFYDPTQGEILLDGVPIHELSLDTLRSQIGIVPQTPLLFSGSIKDNIRIGKPEATDKEVEEAAKQAYAHDFILQQEQGYDTEVSEKGMSLSGGQRQRIAIARAFLKDAPILLLDEATSALDNQSEAEIQNSLEKLTKGRTTLTIAHRFSSLKNASRFLLFNQGEIKADGTHEELLQNSQEYEALYHKSQLS